jgi:hypothetical protein
VKKILFVLATIFGCGVDGAVEENYHYYRFNQFACNNDGGIYYMAFDEQSLCMRYVCFNRLYVEDCRTEIFPR